MISMHHFIGGEWIEGDGPPLTSTNPATGRVNWDGRGATDVEVARAFDAASGALESWADVPAAERVRKIEALAEAYKSRKASLTEAICLETGKPRWEASAEVDSMIAKAAISIAAEGERRRPSSKEMSGAMAGAAAVTRFRPIGVAGVLGPFNMPGHLPNGHLVPAVLAGNTVIFKPSERTPLVGQRMAEAWESARLPTGVFNLVQGGSDTGASVVRHPALDALLFTGSAAAGRAINRTLADYPEKLLALEMGGNNPLIVWDCEDLEAAVYVVIQSAFVTSGQRCSCARRLIVAEGTAGDSLVNRLARAMAGIRVGFFTDDPEPFMGTLISAEAAAALLDAQAGLRLRGAQTVVEMKADPRSPALLSPGLIDVTGVKDREDVELFGPLLQLIRASDFDAALREANATRYGLSAGLVSDRRELYDRFSRRNRAGVVNWNRPLTGASSLLPFGGVGFSGNHRPSAYYAADYCSYPVASLEADRAALPETPLKGIEIRPTQ